MKGYDDQTIIACSSGLVTCAISIVRISGRNFFPEIQKFISTDLTKLKPRHASFCEITSGTETLDEVVIVWFKGPASYNGEDILEISAHGNPLNINRIIETFLSVDSIRPAMPGEFSLRAVNNNKLSLSQVEGLDLLLNANSIFALNQGYSVLSGRLKAQFEELYDSFIHHRSSMELGFDFLEDVGEEQFDLQLKESFKRLDSIVKNLASHIADQNYNLIKPEVALVGLPNSGKSSLFNLLVGTKRSIVSEIAGTTRDYITEDLNIDNSIYKLIDTAGVRKATDAIEEEGISRALEIAKTAFYKILLINPQNFDENYFLQISEIEFDEIIFTHSDSTNFYNKVSECLSILMKFQSGPIEPYNFAPIEPREDAPIGPVKFGPIEPNLLAPIEPFRKSSESGSIEPLSIAPIGPLISKSCIASLVGDNEELISSISLNISLKYQTIMTFDPILISRHIDSIKNIHSALVTYEGIFNTEQDLSIISSELNILGRCISELIGIVSPDDVLHNIFDNFCIGK
jgi:tRNA modification GTPase